MEKGGGDALDANRGYGAASMRVTAASDRPQISDYGFGNYRDQLVDFRIPRRAQTYPAGRKYYRLQPWHEALLAAVDVDPGVFCRQPHLAQAWPSGYITGNMSEVAMGSSQKRAIKNYRSRLSERGLARFEVLGLTIDRDLIRSLARRLAEDGPEVSQLRIAVSRTIAGEPPKKGGILAALRRSPLVGADLDVTRSREEGREVEI